MSFTDIYKLFPDQTSCITYLEEAKWPDGPVCPYCLSERRIVRIKDRNRYHCNVCNTGFSVTVNTIFHDTKLSLQKWFFAINLINSNKEMTIQKLQKEIEVTYKTAWFMTIRIRRAMRENQPILQKIIEVNERAGE
jgi:transposase-like protein